MTYHQAIAVLPSNATVTSWFGNPGSGGFREFWRTPDGRRYEIANGSYLDTAPFNWVIDEVAD